MALSGIIALVPHPDDETYSFGGTLALAAAKGWPVTIVAATAGERGERHDGVPPDPVTLAPVRRAELAASCAVLGTRLPACWDLPDGGLDRNDVTATQRVVALVNERQPALVLALGRDGAYGHPDHLAVYNWVERARPSFPDGTAVLYAAFEPGIFAAQHARSAGAGVLGNPPAVAVGALGSVLADYEVAIAAVRQQKLDAIRAHRSQLPSGDPYGLFPEGAVGRLLNVERFTDAAGEPSPALARLLATLTESQAEGSPARAG